MKQFLTLFKYTTIIVCFLSVSACKEAVTERKTLASIDTLPIKKHARNEEKVASTDTEIRDAYINYLEHASKQDLSRSDALNRLAAIEFKLSEQYLQESEEEVAAALLADKKLQRTIALLETSLKDYPKAKHNDVTLYQIAKAYDQSGDYEKTHNALKLLVKNYPKSIYYLESQFRLAEYAFSAKQYLIAEDKYTGIISAKNNSLFYQKSLYKRGWARFKQEFYIEAADDFVNVINDNNFQEFEQLSDSKKNVFNEYYRALGLSFSYLGGAEPLHQYFQQTPKVNNYYHVYRSLSDIFLKQELYSDAVTTLNSFIKHNPQSEFAPLAALQVINLWKKAGFVTQRNKAFERFYQNYQPGSAYWQVQGQINKKREDEVFKALKTLILTETATYHKKYQQQNKNQDFAHALRWYNNYLQHFDLFSRQDNIYFLLASLYAQHNDHAKAYQQYLLAGFDEETIMNKEAAYQSITLASTLYSASRIERDKNKWLEQLLRYSQLYAEQYPNDKLSLNIIDHATDLAYKNGKYKHVIILAELVVAANASATLKNINTLQAHAYFQEKDYATAESAYISLLENNQLSTKENKTITEGIALSIYYQGEMARTNNNSEQATEHYARIYLVVPNTETAATGLYDAIAVSIQNEKWLQAIDYIKDFRQIYPGHVHSDDVAKKLSVAYLNSKQDIAAAKELEKLSSKGSSKAYKMASLLKAAQLYQANNDNSAAIRSYEKYVNSYTKPFAPYFDSLYQLAKLNLASNNLKKTLAWQKKILSVDKKTPSSDKDEYTNVIASNAAIYIARKNNDIFSRIKLVAPLKKNLKRKKTSMQRTVNFYARASSYGVAETATEGTFAIAQIYNDFSLALLNSEIPKHLNADEKEQYLFLLEDQAFPFEEKAIEFFEVNMLYTKDGIYDEWVIKSHLQLQHLFPTRYKRSPKLESVINVLH